mmetsp:Transcript_93896/g.243048  ORF Transcript_93896/g.243048 Transcript_93896/m.243048 type:complete len:322 (+) Transcript_93896:91-1056(+)
MLWWGHHTFLELKGIHEVAHHSTVTRSGEGGVTTPQSLDTETGHDIGQVAAAEMERHQWDTDTATKIFDERLVSTPQSLDREKEHDFVQTTATEMERQHGDKEIDTAHQALDWEQETGSANSGKSQAYAKESFALEEEEEEEHEIVPVTAVVTEKHSHETEMGAEGLGSKQIIDSQATTTAMIRNIACRLKAGEVAEALDSAGLGGTYNFVFVPISSKRTGPAGMHKSNLGYAFVDFKHRDYAQRCYDLMHGKRLGSSKTKKTVEVVLAGATLAEPSDYGQEGSFTILATMEADHQDLRMSGWSEGLYYQVPMFSHWQPAL